MIQNDYELIISCIQYGAPAVANRLVKAFNDTIDQVNQFNEMKRRQAMELANEKRGTEETKATEKTKETKK